MATVTVGPSITRVNLVIKQGTAMTIDLTTVNKLGQPITNTTGYQIQAQIRSLDDDVLFEWSTDAGNAALTYFPSDVPPRTLSVLTMSAAQSAALDFYLARWDCFLIPPSGAASAACLAEGSAVLERRITH